MNRLKRLAAGVVALAAGFLIAGKCAALAISVPQVAGLSDASEANVKMILGSVVAVAYGAMRLIRKATAKPGDTVEAGYTTTEFYMAVAALAKIFGLGF